MKIMVALRHDGPAQAAPALAPAFRRLAVVTGRAGRTLRLWSCRSEQRRRLRLLEVRELADLGLSLDDVICETRKHFWQP